MPKFSCARSITIDAPPEVVFEKVADFSDWTPWSPWLSMEPDANVTVSQDSSSVGSTYAWNGELVGAGEMEHLRLSPNQSIESEIRFTKPFKSTSMVAFELNPEGAQATRLTWRMDGSLPWFLFWMKSMMEPFIGMDYERGLRMLKQWIETGRVTSKTTVKGVQPAGPISVWGVRRTCALSDIGATMRDAFEQAESVLKSRLPSQLSSETGGEAVSVYHRFDIKKQIVEFTSGFHLPNLTENPVEGGLEHWSLDKCDAVRVDHLGSYQHLGNAWGAAQKYAQVNKLKLSKSAGLEIYRNDPVDTPEAKLLTEIYLPLRG